MLYTLILIVSLDLEPKTQVFFKPNLAWRHFLSRLPQKDLSKTLPAKWRIKTLKKRFLECIKKIFCILSCTFFHAFVRFWWSMTTLLKNVHRNQKSAPMVCTKKAIIFSVAFAAKLFLGRVRTIRLGKSGKNSGTKSCFTPWLQDQQQQLLGVRFGFVLKSACLIIYSLQTHPE